jgi:hypothetical protein
MSEAGTRRPRSSANYSEFAYCTNVHMIRPVVSVSNSVLNFQYRGRYNTGISKMSIPVLAGIEFFFAKYNLTPKKSGKFDVKTAVKCIFTGKSKFSVNGENLPVITGKFMKINTNQYTPRKKFEKSIF